MIQQRPDGSGTSVWHNGSNTMWYTVLIIEPENDLVLAVTSNTASATRVEKLAARMAKVLLENAKQGE